MVKQKKKERKKLSVCKHFCWGQTFCLKTKPRCNVLKNVSWLQWRITQRVGMRLLANCCGTFTNQISSSLIQTNKQMKQWRYVCTTICCYRNNDILETRYCSAKWIDQSESSSPRLWCRIRRNRYTVELIIGYFRVRGIASLRLRGSLPGKTSFSECDKDKKKKKIYKTTAVLYARRFTIQIAEQMTLGGFLACANASRSGRLL